MRASDVMGCDARDASFRGRRSRPQRGSVVVIVDPRPGWIPIRAYQRIPSRMRTTDCLLKRNHPAPLPVEPL